MKIDYSKRKKGQSKREYFAEVTGQPASSYDGGSGGSSSNSDTSLSKIVKEILGATPGFNAPSKTFDETYTPEQQAEDRKQSEALFKPYFEKQISDSLEDLNAWSETDSVNYERTLRQGRAKMAQLGAAIGTERTNWEANVNKQQQSGKQAQVRNTERSVGSDAIKRAGYTSQYGDRIGTITDSMNAAIEDQVLWYRDQAQARYNSNASATYQSPSSKNYLGKSL